jgi:proteasome assembly chaperone (PAC2) family protein
MEQLIYLEQPALDKPYLIAGFEGWPNAAEVSSYAIQYLVENLEARKFASIPTDNFYKISSLRPTAVVREGRLTDLKIPGNHFYYSKDSSSRDLILFHGIEPHFHWNAFVATLFKLVDRYEIPEIITIGGTYDYIPHTYPPMVSAVFNHDSLRERIVEAGVALTEYTGPISIHSFILEAARKKGLRAISLWGHAPQYLQAKNVKVVYSVLQKLVDLTEMDIDLSDLQRAGEYFDEQVNQLLSQDPKLQEVISKLEEVYERSGELTPPGKEDTAKEEKVVYMQAFLKKQEDEEKKEG